MFNSGYRGDRAGDNKGVISPQTKFLQAEYPIPAISGYTLVGTDDLALSTAGGQTVLVNGTGFAPGCSAIVNGITVSPVTVISPTQISFTSPAISGGTYALVVYNSAGGGAILVPGLVYSSVPAFGTAATLPSYYETQAISTNIVATSDSTVTYALTSGSLPPGATISSGGLITGTAPVTTGSSTYTFSITATDAELQDVTRTFTLTVNTDVISWTTPANNSTIVLGSDTYTQALSATAGSGSAITYSADSLPAGLTLTAGTISGIPTLDGTTSSVLTATAATTRTGTSSVTWIVQLSTQVMYNVILLSADTSVQMPTFLEDDSKNNLLGATVADTRGDIFNPLQTGYYSSFFSATANYLTGTTTFNPTSQTRAWTVEFWFMPLNTTSVNIFAIGAGTAFSNAFYINWGATANKFTFYQGNGTSNPVNIVSTSTYTVGQWHHVAVTNDALGVRRLFVNGVLDGTQTYTAAALSSATTFVVNGAYDNLGLGNGGGTFYISNLRIVPDQTLYVSAFAVPTTPALAIPGTALLLCNSNRPIDSSITNTTVTVTGTPRTTSSNPYSAVNQADTQYYSTYFNGTTDYLSMAASPTFQFPGDFTIEAWVYMAAPATGGPYSVFGVGSSTTNFDFRYQSNQWQVSLNAGSGTSLGGSGTLVPNTWTHVALVKSDYYVRCFVNGIQTATKLSVSGTLGSATATAYIGASDTTPGNKMNGLISNLRITKGYAVYGGNFTPPTADLTATTAITSAQSWSTGFNNAGTHYLSTPSNAAFAWGTGDFTTELWLYTTESLSATERMIAGGYAIGGGLFSVNTGGLKWVAYNVQTILTSTFVPAIGQWYHIAYSRSGTTGRLFVNGSIVASGTDSTNYTYSTFYIGTNGGSGSTTLSAHISNLRAVKGQALYTAAFTPATTPLTTTSQGATASNVSLLTCQDNLIQDNSPNRFVITATGTPTPKTTAVNPFTNINAIGGLSYSNYFDGTGDYLTLATPAVTAIGTNSFTWEAWVYPINTTYAVIYDTSASGDATATGRFLVQMETGGQIRLLTLAGTGILLNSGTNVIQAGQWTHIAICRSGTSGYMFFNGALVATGTVSTNFLVVTASGTNRPIIGANGYNTSNGWNGYISNLRLVNGTALYTAAFAPSTTPLTAIANTALLTCQSSTFVDNSGNLLPITPANDVKTDVYNPFGGSTSLLSCQSATLVDNSAIPRAITSASGAKPLVQSPYRNQYYSNFFNSSSIAVPNTSQATLNVASGATFTIEAWVNLTSLATASPIVVDNVAGNSLVYWNFTIQSTGYLSFNWYPGSTVTCTALTTAMTAGTWYHVAVSVNAGAISLYVNGIPQALGGTSTLSTPSANTGTITIGQYASPVVYTSGYISNVRITKNQALYTAAFTPSTTPLTTTSQGATAANVSLLTCQSVNFVDNSATMQTVTRTGTTIISAVSPFTQPSGYTTTPITTYGSVYFDGTGDYVSFPSSSGLAFGTGDFTMEGWFFFVSPRAQSYPSIFTNSLSGSLAANIWGLYYDRTDSTGAFRLYVGNVNTVTQLISTASPYSLYNRWSHIAFVRRSGTYYIFVDGTQIFSGANAVSIDGGVSEAMHISYPTTGGLYGHVSNVRLTKGTAIYTGNFQPHFTLPLTAVTNTQLLTFQNRGNHNNSAIVDNSGSNNAIARVGNVSAGAFSPYGTNFSTYFSGTSSQWLSVPGGSGSSVDLTGDFTVEAWVFPTARLFLYPILIDTSTTNDANRFAIWLGHNSFTTTKYQVNLGASTTSSTASIVYNTWTHLAVVRSGTTVKLYINGTLDTTMTSSATMTGGATAYIGGGAQDAANCAMQGYLSNLRIVKRAVYLANFTPSKSPLTAVPGTNLLVCQRGNQVDLSVNNTTITQSGTPAVQKFSPFTHTTLPAINYSSYFDGTGDYLTLPSNQSAFIMGTGDFTIEAWVYPSSVGATAKTIYDTMAQSDATGTGRMLIDFNTTLRYSTGAGSVLISGGTMVAKVWQHVAVSRKNGYTRLFLNGVQVGSTYTDTTSYVLGATNRPIIGINAYDASSNPMGGNICDLRVVKGQGLYVTNFTPPTSALTTTSQEALASNVSLLTCQSNVAIDNSLNAFALTSTGDVKSLPVAPYSELNTGNYNSLTFDGTGDNLNIATTPNLNFGTEDFTIEFWYYPNTIPSALSTIMASGNATWGAGAVTILGGTGSTSSTGLRLGVYDYNTATSLVYDNVATPLNQWTHYAFTRTGNNFYLYRNGVQVSTNTWTGSINFNTNNATKIGGGSWDSASVNGLISNLRVVRGTAVYTAAFTPPTSPLTTATTVSSAQSYGVYLDGTGDYLSLAGSNILPTGTMNFTVEFWYYKTNTGKRTLFGGNNSAGSLFIQDSGTTIDVSRYQVAYIQQPAYTNPLNTWVHYALVRNGNTFTSYINGTSIGSVTDATSLPDGSIYIGKNPGNTVEDLQGIVSNLRIVRNQALYSANFTPSTTPLTTTSQSAIASNVSLLTCQNRSIIDNSTNQYAITVTGDAKTTSGNPFVSTNGFGTSYSNYFDGTGDYLTVPAGAALSLSNGAFTVEAWIYISGAQTQTYGHQVLGTYSGSSNGYALVVNRSSGGPLGIVWANGSPTGNIATYGTYLSANTWHHIAVVRTSTATNGLTIYLNGVSVVTGTDGINDTVLQTLYIGSQGTANCFFPGLISNVRITKGQALYTSTFTPSTTPLTVTSQGATASNVSLLTCQSATIVDNSSNAIAITRVGDTVVSAINPYSGGTVLLAGQRANLIDTSATGYALVATGDARTTPVSPFTQTSTTPATTNYSPSVYGGSLYFDGSGDYLTIPGSINFNLSTGPWTIECWVYQTSAKTVAVVSEAASVWRVDITSTGVVEFVFNTSSVMASAAGVANPTCWNHIAVTCDGTGGASGVKLFVNGVVRSSGALTPPSDSTSIVYVGRNTDSTAWDMNGYISDLRVLKGVALYTGNFYPSNVPVTPIVSRAGKNYSYPLLINGTNGGINDLSRTANWETVGDTRVAQNSPYFGKYYGYQFNGTSDYLSVSRTGGWIGSGNNFTIEFWGYLTGYTPASTGVYIACPFGTSGAANGFEQGFTGTASSYTGYSFTWKGTAAMTATYTFSLNTWYHIAIVKNGATTTIYINGVSYATSTAYTAWTDNPTLLLGQLGVSGYNFWFPGVVSNARIVDGTAVYTANFTPSTAPLSAITGTTLLTAQSNKFVDNSGNNYTVSIGGNLPKVTNLNPWQITQGVSYYFDGTGDYLRAVSSPLFALGSGDFSIDYWIRPDTLAVQFTVVDFRGSLNNVGFSDYISTNGKINLFKEGGTTYLTTTGSIRAGEWTHVAYVRSSGTVKVYINGVADATTASETTSWVAPSGTNYAVIGCNYTVAAYLNGYITDLRVSKGYARYMANFNPPTRSILHAS